ncbi:PPE domain-containing protein [Actinopolyspora mortivallis]|uniref:PPE domain-containing protein n=1 Tax=Actinopolyspora mortivallis TaxID=33906 RepID=UPI00036B589F|nr:PPE domain-containing protein [Actinopolyspora mortivallis]
MGFGKWLEEQASGVGDAVGSALSSAGSAVSDAAGTTVDAVGDFAGMVRDDVGSVFGFDTRAENAHQEQAAAAAEEGERLRRELAERNRRLDAPAGYDPPAIREQENWRSFSHRRIYDTNQQTLSQSDAVAVAEAWRNIGKELGKLGERLANDSAKAIDSGWSGQAAEAAKQAAQPLARWSQNSGECFHLTGNKIEEAGSAAGQVKAMVPEPQDFDVSRSVTANIAGGPFGGSVDAVRQQYERQQAERQAQETMERVLGNTYRNVDTTVPAYRQLDGSPAHPTGTVSGGATAVGAGSPAGGVAGGGAGGAHPAGIGSVGSSGGYPGGGSPGGGYPGTGAPGPGAGGDGQPPRSGGNTPQSVPGTGSPTPPSGSESAWAPDTSTGRSGFGAGGPGAGGAAGGVGGAGGGAGGYVGGGLGGGTGTGSGPGPGGRSGAAPVKGGASPTSGPGAAAAPGAGRSGGRAPMGMGPAGQRGQGGEDEEHERPNWLEEWDDVWFNDMPRTAPPVIE